MYSCTIQPYSHSTKHLIIATHRFSWIQLFFWISTEFFLPCFKAPMFQAIKIGHVWSNGVFTGMSLNISFNNMNTSIIVLKNLKNWVLSTRKLRFLMVNFQTLWTEPLSATSRKFSGWQDSSFYTNPRWMRVYNVHVSIVLNCLDCRTCVTLHVPPKLVILEEKLFF